MTPEQKELIEEKFKGVHALIQANFDVVNEKLFHITQHVEKTNGRVTKLEDSSDNCPTLVDIRGRVIKLEKWQWKSMGYVTGAIMVISFVFKYLL